MSDCLTVCPPLPSHLLALCRHWQRCQWPHSHNNRAVDRSETYCLGRLLVTTHCIENSEQLTESWPDLTISLFVVDDNSDPNPQPVELYRALDRLHVAEVRLHLARQAVRSLDTQPQQPSARLTTTITVADKAGHSPSLVTNTLLSGPAPSALDSHRRVAQSPSNTRPPAVHTTSQCNRYHCHSTTRLMRAYGLHCWFAIIDSI